MGPGQNFASQPMIGQERCPLEDRHSGRDGMAKRLWLASSQAAGGHGRAGGGGTRHPQPSLSLSDPKSIMLARTTGNFALSQQRIITSKNENILFCNIYGKCIKWINLSCFDFEGSFIMLVLESLYCTWSHSIKVSSAASELPHLIHFQRIRGKAKKISVPLATSAGFGWKRIFAATLY